MLFHNLIILSSGLMCDCFSLGRSRNMQLTKVSAVFCILKLSMVLNTFSDTFCSCCRLAPESFQDLEQFVTEFYSGLPCTTVICISLIGGPCANLLKDLLQYPSCISAWMLLSRLKFKSQPIMMLLPVNKVLEGTLINICLDSWNSLFSHTDSTE
jgi:hypothetical protein